MLVAHASRTYLAPGCHKHGVQLPERVLAQTRQDPLDTRSFSQKHFKVTTVEVTEGSKRHRTLGEGTLKRDKKSFTVVFSERSVRWTPVLSRGHSRTDPSLGRDE